MQANYQAALFTPAPDNQGWSPCRGATEVSQPATLSPLALDYPHGPFGPEEAAIRAPVHAFPAKPSIPWPSVLCLPPPGSRSGCVVRNLTFTPTSQMCWHKLFPLLSYCSNIYRISVVISFSYLLSTFSTVFCSHWSPLIGTRELVLICSAFFPVLPMSAFDFTDILSFVHTSCLLSV